MTCTAWHPGSGPIGLQSKLIAKNCWVANYGKSEPGVANIDTWQFTDTFPVHGYYTDPKVGYDTGQLAIDVEHNPTPSINTIIPDSWTDELEDVWNKENGRFTLNTAINLRWGARENSALLAVLPSGAKINYGAWSAIAIISAPIKNTVIWSVVTREPTKHSVRISH